MASVPDPKGLVEGLGHELRRFGEAGLDGPGVVYRTYAIKNPRVPLVLEDV